MSVLGSRGRVVFWIVIARGGLPAAQRRHATAPARSQAATPPCRRTATSRFPHS